MPNLYPPAVLGLLAASAAVAAPVAESIVFVTHPTRNVELGVTDMSADGAVIVGTVEGPGIFGFGDEQVFRWTPAGGFTTIVGSTEHPARGYAVSADGSVVVGTRRVDVDGTRETHGFRWTLIGGTQTFSTVRLFDVSHDGLTAVGQRLDPDDNDGDARVLRFDAQGNVFVQDIEGVATFGRSDINALAVSGDGSRVALVAGTGSNGTGRSVVFAPISAGTVSVPGLPLVTSGIPFEVHGNTDGSVWTFGNDRVGGTSGATVFRSGSAGLLHDGGSALNVDHAGTTFVGTTSFDGVFGGATLWTDDGATRISLDQLARDAGLLTSRDNLLTATAIDADGNVIAGRWTTGLAEGFYVLTLGEPCIADVIDDGTLDIDDVLAFLNAFAAGDPAADVAPPTGTFDIDDVLTFLSAFAAGCP